MSKTYISQDGKFSTNESNFRVNAFNEVVVNVDNPLTQYRPSLGVYSTQKHATEALEQAVRSEGPTFKFPQAKDEE